MVFSSIVFLFRFLPIFMLCYFCAPGRMKNMVLLLGSLIFYAWGEPIYILLMLFSIASDYVHGIVIEKKRGTIWSKVALVSSITINLLMLGVFKYLDFLPLPVGISFYTFQTMSYTIDVYRGEAKVQRNLLDFAVFVTMFPQLIAGPIVKYTQVEERLAERKPDLEQISYGCKRFVLGLAKKVLLANNMGILWDLIKNSDAGAISVMTAWLGILAFALQIYFDFSGYSDMAIGLGAILGFSFPENFNYPYISKSVTEFWRRWHMSLSGWFKEYVYIPLGGNRKGLPRQFFNILVVWMLTGIWHGAGWNFLMWGLWFAFLLVLEKLFLGKVLEKLPAIFGHVYSLMAVLISWVIFELESVSGIIAYIGSMFGVHSQAFLDREALYYGREYWVLFAISAIAATPVCMVAVKKLKSNEKMIARAVYACGEKLVPVLLLLLSIAYIVDASYNPFLYFRF